MRRKLFCILLLSGVFSSYANFKFTGNVPAEYSNSKIYLTVIDDYSKSNLLITENILKVVEIDSIGNFCFEGDFLSEQNQLYNIHLDACSDITNYHHLINTCNYHQSILFIANNNDSIFFPLNELGQSFCSIEHSSKDNIVIQKIDSIQEILLQDLHETKGDLQREILFSTYIKGLQDFSSKLDEPLGELYAYNLYANRNSFGRAHYLKDLKKNEYYSELEKKLEESYPNSPHYHKYKQDLDTDLGLINNKPSFSFIHVLLILSVSLNIYYISTRFLKQKTETVDYKKLLSTQEQKVFELINQGLSNKEIADQLFISTSTIKTHINAIYSKLNISSRKEVSSFFKQ